MSTNQAYIVHYKGREVQCYGDLEESSNFDVVCDDGWDDDIWCIGIVGPLNWETVVSHLQLYFESDILEISAC